MLRFKDWLMLFATLSSVAAGILLPDLGTPLQPLPMYCMMALLFFSFLSLRPSSVIRSAGSFLFIIARHVVIKLVVLPLPVFFLFRILCPKYALAALLLSGISSGVSGPFFAILVNANLSIVLGMSVVTSVLVPFTLPLIARVFAAGDLEISVIDMSRLLCFVVFVPLIVAELMGRFLPVFSDRLSRIQYPVSLTSFVITNLGMFSKYDAFLRAAPGVLVGSLVVATILAGIYFVAGIIFSPGSPLADRLAVIISFAVLNNVLVLVFSATFFGPLEAVLAAIYSVPFFTLIIPLRLYEGWVKRRGGLHN